MIYFELWQYFGTSGRYLCFRKKKLAMSEIIIFHRPYPACRFAGPVIFITFVQEGAGSLRQSV